MTKCGVCNIQLPAAATQPWCDDHEDGYAPPLPDPPPPNEVMHIVHSAAISKRTGGLEDVESGLR